MLQIAGTIAASTPNSSPWHCLQGGPAKESTRRTSKAKDRANLRTGRQKEREEGLWTTALTAKGLAETQHPRKHFDL